MGRGWEGGNGKRVGGKGGERESREREKEGGGDKEVVVKKTCTRGERGERGELGERGERG